MKHFHCFPFASKNTHGTPSSSRELRAKILTPNFRRSPENFLRNKLHRSRTNFSKISISYLSSAETAVASRRRTSRKLTFRRESILAPAPRRVFLREVRLRRRKPGNCRFSFPLAENRGWSGFVTDFLVGVRMMDALFGGEK